MKNTFRRLIIPAALVVGLIGFAVPQTYGASAAVDTNATITLGLDLEPTSLDLTGTAGAPIPQVLLDNVYESLVRINDKGVIVPNLASSWKIAPDGKTYTFTLANAKFHDGSAFTSADVLWSYNRVTAKDSTNPFKTQFANVSSVFATGGKTIIIKMKNRDNSFLFNLTGQVGVVLKAKSANLDSTANGTGPYKFSNWNRGTSITLVRNDAYRGTKGLAKTVVFRYISNPNALNNAFLSGQVDVLTTVQAPEILKFFVANDKFKVVEGTTNGEVTMSMNNDNAYFKNPKVRLAVRQAIDHKALIQTAWSGFGSTLGSFVPPTDPWYEDLTGLAPYNVSASKALLADAGYPNGFKVTLDIPPIGYATASSEFIQASLKKVGIDVTINNVGWGEWIDRIFTKGNYDMTIVAHVEPHDIAIYGNPGYYFHYNNTDVQGWLKAADEAATDAERTALLKKVGRQLAVDSASDWLFLLPATQVVTKKISGIPTNSLGLSYYVASIAKTK
jgi:peptide/nickel transport system substrate-binding protein